MNWTANRGLVVLALFWSGIAAADQRVEWLLERGLPFPMMEWAPRYEHGEGVSKDLYSAMRLYCYAAIRHRNSEAMYAPATIFSTAVTLLIPQRSFCQQQHAFAEGPCDGRLFIK
jgi:hypothetical protein